MNADFHSYFSWILISYLYLYRWGYIMFESGGKHTNHKGIRENWRKPDKQSAESTPNVYNLDTLKQISCAGEVRLHGVGVCERREMRAPVHMCWGEGAIHSANKQPVSINSCN